MSAYEEARRMSLFIVEAGDPLYPPAALKLIQAADKEIATIKNDLDRQIAVWQSDARAWQKTVSTRDAELARLREALRPMINGTYFITSEDIERAREAIKS